MAEMGAGELTFHGLAFHQGGVAKYTKLSILVTIG